jgi:aspartate aminotransferase-like enzyme
MGARVDRLEVPWGEAPDPAAIAARLRTRDYRAVVCVHNESSTGVVADLGGIGAVVRASPALLIVDSVSGVGGVEMRMDEWGVDVLVAASQKALMCPPGLAFAALSEKAERVVEAARGVPRFFFDFRRMKSSLLKGGQRTKLSGRVIRFGTMGWVDDGDILTDLQHLECTLRDLGEAPPAGAGVAAAARVLAA